MISGDGDNVLRLKNDVGAAITPDEFVLPADEGEGECVFEIEEAAKTLRSKSSLPPAVIWMCTV